MGKLLVLCNEKPTVDYDRSEDEKHYTIKGAK